MWRWKAWWRQWKSRLGSWMLRWREAARLPFGRRRRRPAWEWAWEIPVPGFRPEEIEVTLWGDTLWVRAQRRWEDFRRHRSGFWFCSGWHGEMVALPVGAISPSRRSQVRAEYRDGFLRLFLPRGERPRRIPVRRARQ